MQPQSCQFVGYWGYGSHEELQSLLAKVLIAAPATWGSAQRFSQQRNRAIDSDDCLWGVGCIGSNQSLPHVAASDNVIVTLSASGLPNSADAWISVQRNNRLLSQLILGR